MHPNQVLFQGEARVRALPVCDHYAGTEVRMQKAMQLQETMGPVFDITLDCEDGAPVGQEKEHAELITELLHSQHNRHKRVGVRIHDPLHPSWKNDVAQIVGHAAEQLAYVMIPKIHSLAEVQTVIDEINRVANQRGHHQKIPIQTLIETHPALHEVYAIAAHDQIESLSFGLMDFISEHHGAIPSQAMDREQFDHPLVARAMLEISAACHAHGKVPSHNVCTNIHQLDVIESDTLRAKNEFGYTRKWSIHPNQIPVIVKALMPSSSEIDFASEIILLAQQAHWGPIQHAGKLHDRASYRFYWTTLQQAFAGGQKVSDKIEQLLKTGQ